MRTEAGSFGTARRGRRASPAATTRRTWPSPTMARDRRLQHLAARRRERRLAPRHASRCAAGATLLPGVTLDFTVRNSDKTADRDGFGGPAGGTLADRHRRPLHARSPGAAGRRQPALGHARRRADPRVPRQPQQHDHGRSPTAPSSRASASNISETDKYAYLATYRLDMPALWMKHAFTGRVEKEDERFTPYGDFADGLRARARAHGLHGRMARRLRRPAVPDRRHPPRRQRQLPGLHDLARGRLAGAARDSTCGRTPASARP